MRILPDSIIGQGIFLFSPPGISGEKCTSTACLDDDHFGLIPQSWAVLVVEDRVDSVMRQDVGVLALALHTTQAGTQAMRHEHHKGAV